MNKSVGKIEPRRLKGFQDYDPVIMEKRYAILDHAQRLARFAGFQLMGTPALEYAEVLLGEGGETDKQVYKFRDNGDREVAMRFDLTMSFARYVAENLGTLNIPFKRIQFGDVWRAEKPQKGRYREFCQCDLDVIGVDSMAADVDVLLCLNRILDSLQFGSFTQMIGNRVILGHLIKKFYPELDPAGEGQAFIALDKLDKVGPDKVAELLDQQFGPQNGAAKKLLALLLKKRDGDTDLDGIREVFVGDDAARLEVQRLSDTVTMCRSLTKGSRGRIVIDLSIARGLGYYTGIVFETVADNLKALGSISSGGRYNRLLERFSDRELPGVGGSIGVDRLVAVIDELGALKSDQRQGVFVAVATDNALGYAFELAGMVRQGAILADVSVKTGKLGNQFKYAERGRYRFILTVGEKERDARVYSIKDLVTGAETRDLPLSGLKDHLSTLHT